VLEGTLTDLGPKPASAGMSNVKQLEQMQQPSQPPQPPKQKQTQHAAAVGLGLQVLHGSEKPPISAYKCATCGVRFQEFSQCTEHWNGPNCPGNTRNCVVERAWPPDTDHGEHRVKHDGEQPAPQPSQSIGNGGSLWSKKNTLPEKAFEQWANGVSAPDAKQWSDDGEDGPYRQPPRGSPMSQSPHQVL